MNNDPVYCIKLEFSHNGGNITDSEKCPTEQLNIEYET